MNEPIIIGAYTLKVPKKLGEKVIRFAIECGLLSKDLKIQRDDGHLFIPLNRKPSLEHFPELYDFEVERRDFVPRRRQFRTAVDIAQNILPKHLVSFFPRSIDFVGDIAIIDVPPELEEHKRIVGETIIEAYKNVRTVISKASSVQGTFRTREYDVIAGSSDMKTVHKENGCIYHLDLGKVYFSPRLSYEHHRVASCVKENEVVVDMFAGIGPFSILIAKTHEEVKVYAIDLNPDAILCIKKNIMVNKVWGKVVPVCGDTRNVVYEKLFKVADRVIMNLPAKSEKYIKTACLALKKNGGTIHYYSFSEGPDPVEMVESKMTKYFRKIDREITFSSARIVREVAPFKWQVSVDLKIQ